MEADARGLENCDSPGASTLDASVGFVEAEDATRGDGRGLALCPSSEAAFLLGPVAGEAEDFVVFVRRGLSIDEAPESSDSSVSLSPLMLLDLRMAKDEGGRRPPDVPGECPSWLKDGTGEAAVLRRACASRNAATDIRWEESTEAKLPSRGRGRTGGSMAADGDSLGDSGPTWRKERRLNESVSREIAGSGADAGGDLGSGGGLDFLRSRLAQEKNPPLPFFWGGAVGEPAPGG